MTSELLPYLEQKPFDVLRESGLPAQEYLRNYWHRLIQLIMNSPITTQDFYVYRGTKLDVYQSDTKRIYVSDGFFSTSMLIERARKFSKDQNLTRIKIPKGSRALYLAPVSHITNEHEFLLPDHASFYLVSRWKQETYFKLPGQEPGHIQIPTQTLSLTWEPPSRTLDDQRLIHAINHSSK